MSNGSPSGCCGAIFLYFVLTAIFIGIGFPQSAAMVLAALIFVIPVAWGIFGDQIKEKLKNVERQPPPTYPKVERPWQERTGHMARGGPAKREEGTPARGGRPRGEDAPTKADGYAPGTPAREPANYYDALEEEQRRSHRKKYGG